MSLFILLTVLTSPSPALAEAQDLCQLFSAKSGDKREACEASLQGRYFSETAQLFCSRYYSSRQERLLQDNIKCLSDLADLKFERDAALDCQRNSGFLPAQKECLKKSGTPYTMADEDLLAEERSHQEDLQYARYYDLVKRLEGGDCKGAQEMARSQKDRSRSPGIQMDPLDIHLKVIESYEEMLGRRKPLERPSPIRPWERLPDPAKDLERPSPIRPWERLPDPAKDSEDFKPEDTSKVPVGDAG